MIVNEPVLIPSGLTEIIRRCKVSGPIDSPEDAQPDYDENFEAKYRKIIVLMDTYDPNMKVIATGVSNKDKTWELLTAPVQENGKMAIASFDLSGQYNAQIYDRASLENVVFYYDGSNLKVMGTHELLMHKRLMQVDRFIQSSFCNWLMSLSRENVKGAACELYTRQTVYAENAMTFIMDIATNWGDSNYIAIRSIEFYDTDGIKIPYSETTGHNATSQYSDYYAYRALLCVQSL